jgi:hypothetical protein
MYRFGHALGSVAAGNYEVVTVITAASMASSSDLHALIAKDHCELVPGRDASGRRTSRWPETRMSSWPATKTTSGPPSAGGGARRRVTTAVAS